MISLKPLPLIPEMNGMTTRQVADYFEVPVSNVATCYKRNRKTIDAYGSTIMKPNDFMGLESIEARKEPYMVCVTTPDGTYFEVPNCGTRLFQKESVIQIGFLLKTSAVAQQLREYRDYLFSTYII